MRCARHLSAIGLSFMLTASLLGAKAEGKDGASRKGLADMKDTRRAAAMASRNVSPLADLAGVMPAHGTASVVPAKRWEDAFVSGNSRVGAMAFGDPRKETIVGDHCRLFLPLGSPCAICPGITTRVCA